MDGARIGRDCNIGGHCFVESGVRIGNGVTVKNGVMLWDGVHIGDHAFIGPQVAFTNDKRPRSPRLPLAARRYRDTGWMEPTRIGTGATIGSNATILCGLRIGRFAMVGAGAVVTCNVPAFTLWLGVPARLGGYVCACSAALGFEDRVAKCGDCGRRYRRRGTAVTPVAQ